MTTFDSLALLLICLIILLLSSVKCCGKEFWTSTTFEPPCPTATVTAAAAAALFKDFVSPALLATALLATAIIATAIAATECCHWDYCCHRDCFVKGLCSKTQAALFAILCPSTIPSYYNGQERNRFEFFTFSFYGFGWCSLLITKSETSNWFCTQTHCQPQSFRDFSLIFSEVFWSLAFTFSALPP